MGYETRFKLSLIKNESNPIKVFREVNGNAEYCLEDDGSSGQEGKWYDHEAELKEFSKLYPHTVFKLEGEGEKTGDIWAKYFQNGKVQVAKAVIKVEEFDASKLK